MLSTLRKLWVLNVSGAPITAKGLESFLALKELYELWLCNTPIDEEAIRRFARKRPNCHIIR
jgi:hypothetical protein